MAKEQKKELVPASEIAQVAARTMLDKKAVDVVILDLRELSSATDFFVIGSGESEVQVGEISKAVVDAIETGGTRINHLEGFRERRWVLLDCIDAVIHVFHGDLREFYGLERLWGDAPIEKIADEGKEEE